MTEPLEPDDSMDEVLQSLIGGFRDEARELLGDMESALMELEERPEDGELVARAFRALHTIKGNGAMFGLTELERFAHDLEHVFDLLRKGQMPVSLRDHRPHPRRQGPAPRPAGRRRGHRRGAPPARGRPGADRAAARAAPRRAGAARRRRRRSADAEPESASRRARGGVQGGGAGPAPRPGGRPDGAGGQPGRRGARRPRLPRAAHDQGQRRDVRLHGARGVRARDRERLRRAARPGRMPVTRETHRHDPRGPRPHPEPAARSGDTDEERALRAKEIEAFHRIVAERRARKRRPAPAPRAWRILFTPERQLFAGGTDPLLVLEELRAMGECSVTALLGAVPALEEIDPGACYLSWEILLDHEPDRCRRSATPSSSSAGTPPSRSRRSAAAVAAAPPPSARRRPAARRRRPRRSARPRPRRGRARRAPRCRPPRRAARSRRPRSRRRARRRPRCASARRSSTSWWTWSASWSPCRRA